MSTVTIYDVESRKQQKESPLYAGRVNVYPKAIDGLFRRAKWAFVAVLLGVYYLAPWLRFERPGDAPDQAILVDMAARKAYFFWIEIWAQEVYYLTGLLILGAFGLFFVTTLFGRVWCGYACPQTVWTDLFMWIERRIQGDRNARIRLDKQPWTAGKVAKKAATHASWLVIALLTGGAWAMYFNDAPTMVANFFTGESSFALYFFVGLFTATTYVLGGLAREQVCTYMCPWPRFQAALVDEDSLVVTYQDWRGEPRGKHKAGQSWEGRGDCVDCKQCVAVCPTGIDIRDGYQLECIGCSLCVDACNDIMDKVGRPRGLITWDSAYNQSAKAKGAPTRLRLIRPRTILYTAIIGVVGAIMLLSLGTRADADLSVLNDRNPLFVTLSSGDIRNGYTVKLLNKEHEARDFTLAVPERPAAEFRVVGQEDAATPLLRVGPDTVATYRVFVTLPRAAVAAETQPLTLVLTDQASGETLVHETPFRGPAS